MAIRFGFLQVEKRVALKISIRFRFPAKYMLYWLTDAAGRFTNETRVFYTIIPIDK